MVMKGVAPDFVGLVILTVAESMKAVNLVQKMMEQGLKLDEVTFAILLNCI